MADNFNFKQFLAENKLGAYSKTGKLNEGFNDHQDINMGDESDAPPTINNPRNPREVAAEIKAQNPSIGQDWAAIKAAAESIMVAAFHAQGLNMGKAMTATRILLGGTHPTYSEFPQKLYDAVTGGDIEETNEDLGLDPGDEETKAKELGAMMGPFGDEADAPPDELNEYGMEDAIYGRGDDDDYDRKSDAERTGAKFVPHKERQPKPSNFTTPSSEAQVLDKLIKKMTLLNRVAIDKYKYAKKENRPAAKEELYKTVKYMLGSNSRYADKVMNGLLQPIHDQWAKYAQSKKS